ncbi:hypothetical protein QJS04_geneDACA022897 [Acorus gramineus]|uniref:Uncharacterized protein n=1 Tax=Acorus gramineus TaxID=55184 RepID=A0AAV9AIC7_ACOGR|nr:hypothetical protein QJS04_geneDACA022897 [Acorus gramineus]
MNLEFSLVQPRRASPFPLRRLGWSSLLRRPRNTRRRSTSVVGFSKDGGGGGGEWWRLKLSDIDADAVQERLNSWLSVAQNALNEMTAPLKKTGQGTMADSENVLDTTQIDEILMIEQTTDSSTLNGDLSLAAIVSIEQFSRMNGSTGRKMQKIFEAVAPESVRNDARSLVEYCCFRSLSRDSSGIHPCLKEPAFQRLLFITMLAWEQPYRDHSVHVASEKYSLQTRLVGEKAFVRVAPAVAGIAETTTAHHLFKAIVGEEKGISISLWTMYISELLKVHEARKSYQDRGSTQFYNEQILCIGSTRKRPVLKWDNNIVWPGNLTLTDRALYFEAIGLTGKRDVRRMDLTGNGSRVEKARVGPLGSAFFDSAVSISSSPASETWVLEFIDFGGEMRRDVWYAFISEIISLHKFIREFGPGDGDYWIRHVYGARRGKARAITSAANGIARLQSLQYIQRLSEDPVKLVHFSYLRNAPYGDVVLQTLALSFWGGPLITNFKDVDGQPTKNIGRSEEISSSYISDVDGSIYLRKWMTSPSWTSTSSVTFWKNLVAKQGIVLGKNHVVADLNVIERAALICKEKSQVVEKTQATIDAAMIKGIPSNIDLFKFKEQILSNRSSIRAVIIKMMCVVYVKISIMEKLPKLENLNVTLMTVAATMLLLKGLKEQGRLGRYFGKITIRDQPPSNTIQKIIAVKEAMADVESFLQNLNVTLLKFRSIVLSGQPERTTEVALVLICAATVLLIVPFKYIVTFVLCDLFTRELEFRREMVVKFKKFLKDRWATVPAAPVVVLPSESEGTESSSSVNVMEQNDQRTLEGTERIRDMGKSS